MFDRLDALEDPGPGEGPLVRLQLGADGSPVGAAGALRSAAPPERVWSVIRDVERYPERVPLVHRARRDGDDVAMQLRFRIALLSAKFGFVVTVTSGEERWLELGYVSGEPRDMRLRFEIEPVEDGRRTLTRIAVSYDIYSLGWLVKFFLRHHPEIQHGVLSGTTLVLLDSVQRAATAQPG